MSNRIIQKQLCFLVGYFLIITACGPEKMNHRSESPSLSLFSGKEVQAKLDQNGVLTAGLEASETETQIVSASGESAIAGTQVAFPPGSLPIATDVTIQQGTSISADQLNQELGLGEDVGINASSPAVVISSSEAVDLSQPFTIALSLPEPSAYWLTEPNIQNLVVAYRVKKQTEGETVVGLKGADELKIMGKKVLFDSLYFGSFQVMILSKKVETQEVKSSAASTLRLMIINFSSQIPSCGQADVGLTIYVKEESTFKNCTSGGWENLDLNGPQGPTGPAGPAGKPGSSGLPGAAGAFSVRDGQGNDLGYFLGFYNPLNESPYEQDKILIAKKTSDTTFVLDQSGNLGTLYDVEYHYALTNCNEGGKKYIHTPQPLYSKTAFSLDSSLVQTTSLNPPLTRSMKTDGICQNYIDSTVTTTSYYAKFAIAAYNNKKIIFSKNDSGYEKVSLCENNCNLENSWITLSVDNNSVTDDHFSAYTDASGYHLLYATNLSRPTDDLIYLTCSANCGSVSSWKKVTLTSQVTLTNPEITVFSNTLYALYYYSDGSNSGLYYQWCSLANDCSLIAKWSLPVAIRSPLTSMSGLKVRVYSGKIYAVYGANNAKSEKSGFPLRISYCGSTCTTAGNWTTPSLEPSSYQGMNNGFVRRADGKFLIAYADPGSNVINLAYDSLRTWGTTALVTLGANHYLNSFSLTQDQAGNLVLVYADYVSLTRVSTPGRLKMKYCLLASDCTSNSNWVDGGYVGDLTTTNGYHVAMASDQSGAIYLAHGQIQYLGRVGYQLNYATCVANSCTSYNSWVQALYYPNTYEYAATSEVNQTYPAPISVIKN